MRYIFVLILCLAWPQQSLAANPSLVADINKERSVLQTDLCSELVEFKDRYYFCGNGVENEQLWVTDGTESGTNLFFDFTPDFFPRAAPNDFHEFDGHLFFTLSNGSVLYKTDGTSQGTVQIGRYRSINIHGLLNGKLLLSFGTNEFGEELYVIPGHDQAPQLLKDIAEGPTTGLGDGTGFDDEIVILDGKAYFEANDGVSGTDLWVTEGTESSTKLIKDNNPGSGSAFVSDLTAGPGFVVFRSFIGSTSELWRSDGAEAGTFALTAFNDFSPFTFCEQPATLGANLLFCGGTSATGGRELWLSDGTMAGTNLLVDVNPTSDSTPIIIATTQSWAYFTARDDSSGKIELWATDGTALGTKKITERNNIFHDDIFAIKTVGEELVFVAETADVGVALWQTDVENDTFTLVKDFDPLLGEFGASGSSTRFLGKQDNGVAYFLLDVEFDTPKSIWKTDGTESGTQELGSFEVLSSFGGFSSITNFSAFDTFSVFSGGDPEFLSTTRAWIHNGTSTEILKEILPSEQLTTNSSSFSNSVELNGFLYFLTGNTPTGIPRLSLWRTAGTEESTEFVKQLCDQSSCFPGRTEIVVANQTLFILTEQGDLWSSDGTSAGTELVKRVGQDQSGREARKLTAVADGVYFVGWESATGLELWKSDGSETGTLPVTDIHPGTGSAFIASNNKLLSEYGGFPILNNELLFPANDGISGAELWKISILTDEVEQVADIRADESLGSFPKDLTKVGGTVYFAAYTDANGYELWATDGTSGGTNLVRDIQTGNFNSGAAKNSFPVGFTEFEGKALFHARTEDQGYELWITDGTSGGTQLIDNIGGGSSDAFDIVIPSNSDLFRTNLDEIHQLKRKVTLQGEVYFVVDDILFSTELWKTDGTENGTERVVQIDNRNFRSREISSLTLGTGSVDTLYFKAPGDDPTIRLWRTDGTTENTGPRPDVPPLELNRDQPLTYFNDELFFVASDSIKGMELWSFYPDFDFDTIQDDIDNCVFVANIDQENTDTDVLGNACDDDDDNDGVNDDEDAFPLDPNETSDNDGDLIGDNADQDDDNDLIQDADDNCPLLSNPTQANNDGDALGDACDSDDDNDTIDDAGDNCPLIANTDQINTDGDSQGDACDADDDNDAVNDEADNCPLIANEMQLDNDTDLLGDVCDPDDDNDNVLDNFDNCPFVTNTDQLNSDFDSNGDACDSDDDNDNITDLDDNCPVTPNTNQANNDGDAQGDLCDDDDDNEGIDDVDDNCPFIANIDQEDNDEDGVGDVCDSDDDNDLVLDVDDNCPLVENPDQLDEDENNIGDVCELMESDDFFCFPIKNASKTLLICF